MITTTIAQIASGFDTPNRYRLYVVEGEGCVLYVGQSKCAVTRMESHLGRGEWRNFYGSDFDRVLTSNPKAIEYVVTFYDDTDIESAGKSAGYPVDVSDVEDTLIFELSPVFNAQGRKKHRDNIIRWTALYPPVAIDCGEWDDDAQRQ